MEAEVSLHLFHSSHAFRDSSYQLATAINITTRLPAGSFRVRFPEGGGDFSVIQNIQTSSAASIWEASLAVKRPRCETGN
jgi:hypothetical protein